MPPITRSSARPAKDAKGTFPQFKRFPLEIRLAIWEATIEPRIIHLKEYELARCSRMLHRVRSDIEGPCKCLGRRVKHDFSHNFEGDFWMDRTMEIRNPPLVGFKSESLIPPIMLACRESFGVASKAYTRTFGSLGALPETYFNFKLDTLYLDRLSSFSLFQLEPEAMIFSSIPEDELAQVEHLALHKEILQQTPHPPEFTLCLLVARFSGAVKTLTVVTERHKTEPFAKKNDKDESQELAFIDTVNIGRRWYMFEHPKFHVKHIRNPARIPNMHYWVKPADPDLDAARNYYEGASGIRIESFTMPTIDYKLLTTLKIKTELNRLQHEYERVCSCRCYKNESIAVSQEWYNALLTSPWSDSDNDDL